MLRFPPLPAPAGRRRPRPGSLRLLERLRQDPALRSNLVFALSHSCQSEAVAAVGGANIYLEKHTLTTGFAHFLALLTAYRFQEFPPDRRSP